MEVNVGKLVEAANGDDNFNFTIPVGPKLENIFQEDVFKNRPHQSEDPKARKLFLMRHGERVDFTFGTWIPYCFDETGKYIRKDLNMPESVPERLQGASGYTFDSPLTKVGIFQARTVGEALKEANVDISHVYCSPALRSVQTCDAFLQGCNKRDEIKIKIEPGLFEWLVWYPNGSPDWMTSAELVAAGYNIDQEYQPFVTESKVKEPPGTCEQYYLRNTFVTRGALNAHPDGNVLLVGHSATLEVCSRVLIGEKPRSTKEMTDIIQQVPYCGLLQLTQKSDRWEITELPFPSMTHTTNRRFDLKIFSN